MGAHEVRNAAAQAPATDTPSRHSGSPSLRLSFSRSLALGALLLAGAAAAGPSPARSARGARKATRMLPPLDLRCEYLASPTGIDETAPRLSWRLEAEGRDQRQ